MDARVLKPNGRSTAQIADRETPRSMIRDAYDTPKSIELGEAMFISQEASGPSEASEVGSDVERVLQQAAGFGQHFAMVLAKFEKELDDWRSSVARLQECALEHAQKPKDVPEEAGSADGEADVSADSITLADRHSSKANIVAATITSESRLEDNRVTQYTTGTSVAATSRSRAVSNESSKTDQHKIDRIASAQSVVDMDRAPNVHDLWRDGAPRKKLPSAHRVQDVVLRSSRSAQFDMNHGEQCLDKFVINPVRPTRQVLDITGIAMVIYDLITLPLAAFDFDATSVAKVLRFITVIYWTLDLILGFFAGYQTKEGELEMRFYYSSKKYLRTKFAMDASIVTVDWSLYVLDSIKAIASLSRLTKTARLIRIMRFIRMARTTKMLDLVERVKTWHVTAPIFSLLNVCRLIFNLMIVNHFLGCGWYFVGTLGNDPDTWVAEYLKPNDSMLLRYLVSYHWSIAQFTPCPMPVHPVNLIERIYAVICIIFGLILFASLFGNVTAIINASRKTAYESMMAQHNLKEFLAINKVPYGLSTRVQEFIRRRRIVKVRILERDVDSLLTLSSSLRQELHFQVHGPLLSRHPFLTLVSWRSQDTFIHLCHSACTITTLAVGDEIFHYRTKAQGMLMPLSGHLAYNPGRSVRESLLHLAKDNQFDSQKDLSIDLTTMSDSSLESLGVKKITKGGWLCEFPLWIVWESRGGLSVIQQADMGVIDSAKFQHAASFHGSTLPLLKRYALLFARALSQDAEYHAIDDLWGTRYGIVKEFLSSVASVEAALEEYAQVRRTRSNNDSSMYTVDDSGDAVQATAESKSIIVDSQFGSEVQTQKSRSIIVGSSYGSEVRTAVKQDEDEEQDGKVRI